MHFSRALLLFAAVFLVSCLFAINNSQASNDQAGNNQAGASSQDDKEKEIEDAPIKEKLNFINDILIKYPLRVGDNYSQETKLSLKSSGKLVIYTQYKTTLPCVASREEIFLKDVDLKTVSLIPKDNTIVMIISCKSDRGGCVQRFFRDSCNITFKPKDYLNDVNIITSANQYNAEQIVKAFNEIVKLTAGNSANSSEKNSDDSKSSKIIFGNPENEAKQNSNRSDKPGKGSFTMDDIEVTPKPTDTAQKNKNKNKPGQPTQPGQPEQPDQPEDMDRLIQEILNSYGK